MTGAPPVSKKKSRNTLMRRLAVVCLSEKVVTAGHPLNWSTMTMSVWMILNGLVAGWCFFSGSAGSDGSWLTHSSHVNAALVMSTSMFGQYIDKRARCRILKHLGAC